tara:strand:- start:10753 stop:12429 length:1677 start_codon:yes stop_codon:yes gene_type:complete
MSFEIARMIVQSYRQDNQQRIKNSMEMAYQEALSAFQSEMEARAAAVEVLQMEQKAFDDYVKDISKLRRDIIRGESKTAQKSSEIKLKNQRGQAATDRANLIGRQKAGYAKDQARYRSEKTRAMLGQQDQNLDLQAQDHARRRVKADDMYTTSLGVGVDRLSTAAKIEDDKDANATIEDILVAQIQPQVAASLRERSRQQASYTADPDKMIRFRKADLGYSILNQVKNATGLPDDNPRIQNIKKFLFGGYKTYSSTTQDRVGTLSDVSDISETDVNNKYEEERQAYLKNKGKGFAPKTLGDEPTPPGYIDKEFIPEEVPEGVDRSEYAALRERAAPVFNALRNDFRIDAEELEQLNTTSPQSLDAYRDLQQIAITDPLAVTQEEQLLLDELALKRQFNLLQQRKNIAEMQPTMKSSAEIQSRAADIAEPQEAKDINAADFSPAQQKYFATERQAYELSNKTDNDIRKIGVPEKFGLSLFNETFDKSKKSYVDGQSYDSVLSRLETQFEGKPEEQLRALAAYNSRAMALQRSSNPLIFSDGKENQDYIAALKATAPKVK